MQPESLRVSNSGSYATLDVLCTRERDEECERRSEVLLAELEQSKKRREEVMKMLRDYGNSLAVSPTSQKNIFKFTDKYLSVANECDAEVRNIEQKLKAEKASLAAWRGSQKSFRGVAQLTLFTKRNTVAALTVTYSKSQPQVFTDPQSLTDFQWWTTPRGARFTISALSPRRGDPRLTCTCIIVLTCANRPARTGMMRS